MAQTATARQPFDPVSLPTRFRRRECAGGHARTLPAVRFCKDRVAIGKGRGTGSVYSLNPGELNRLYDRRIGRRSQATLTGQRVQNHDNPLFGRAFRRFVRPENTVFRDCPASAGAPDGTRRTNAISSNGIPNNCRRNSNKEGRYAICTSEKFKWTSRILVCFRV